MRDLLRAEPEGFELGPIVTSEKQYRMPDDSQVKRRPVMSEKTVASAGQAPVGSSKSAPTAQEDVEIIDL